MNKVLIIIAITLVLIIFILAILGGILWFYLFSQDDSEDDKTKEEIKVSLEITEEVISKETDDLIIDVRYPKTNNKKIDQKIDDLIQTEINNFKKGIIDPMEGFPSGIYITYIISNKDPLSIIFNVSTYPSGAAHPVSNTNVFNYDLEEERRMENKDIFKGNYLEVLSEICVEELIKKLEPDEFTIDWIYNGADATEENYEHIALTEDGIIVIFEQYQVATYALGKQSIEISSSEISEILK